LIQNMLEKDTDARFNIHQVLNHKWFFGTVKPAKIFNKTERELIASEFIYVHP
jgi:hypothetical protein